MGLNISWRLVTKSNKKLDTKSPIYLRIRTSDGSSETTINSGLEVEKKYWKDGSVSRKHSDYTNFVRYLAKVQSDVESIITELTEENKTPRPKLVRKRFQELEKKRNDRTEIVLTYEQSWERFLHKKKIETSFYTHRMYKQLYHRLEEFGQDKKVIISFEYLVSEQFETDFKDWSWNKKGYKNSYVRKNLTSIKSFLNYCKRNKFILLDLRDYKKPKEIDRKEVIYLKKDEVLKLSEVKKFNYREGETYRKEIVQIIDVDRRGKEVFYNNWEIVIDLMLFMCVTGCRWNDVHHMTWDSQDFDNETFQWLNQKTKKYTKVPLDPIGIEIVKKYGKNKSREMNIFPKYSSVHFNENIKKIFKDLNLNRLVSVTRMMGAKSVDNEKVPLYQVVSSHVGRRTFIMNLIEKGHDYKTIMSMTGHSDIKSLMKYVSVDDGRIEVGRNLYSNSEGRDSDVLKLFNQLSESNKEFIVDTIKRLVSK